MRVIVETKVGERYEVEEVSHVTVEDKMVEVHRNKPPSIYIPLVRVKKVTVA
jgi:hypothetical protein